MADTLTTPPKITYLCSDSQITGYRIHSPNGYVDLTPSAIKSLARLADVKAEDLVVESRVADEDDGPAPGKAVSPTATKAKKRVTPRKSSAGNKRRESSGEVSSDDSSRGRVTPAQPKKRVSIRLPTEDVRKKMPRRSINKVASYKV